MLAIIESGSVSRVDHYMARYHLEVSPSLAELLLMYEYLSKPNLLSLLNSQQLLRSSPSPLASLPQLSNEKRDFLMQSMKEYLELIPVCSKLIRIHSLMILTRYMSKLTGIEVLSRIQPSHDSC